MRPDTHIKPCSHLWQEWKYAVGSENPGGTIKDAVKKRYLETLVQNGYEQWRQFQVKGIVVPMCEELGKKRKRKTVESAWIPELPKSLLSIIILSFCTLGI